MNKHYGDLTMPILTKKEVENLVKAGESISGFDFKQRNLAMQIGSLTGGAYLSLFFAPYQMNRETISGNKVGDG